MSFMFYIFFQGYRSKNIDLFLPILLLSICSISRILKKIENFSPKNENVEKLKKSAKSVFPDFWRNQIPNPDFFANNNPSINTELTNKN